MTKTDLISAVAAKAEISKKDADKAVSAVISAISDSLVAGEKVQLVGFGTFEVRDRAAREGKTLQLARRSPLLLPKFRHSKLVKL